MHCAGWVHPVQSNVICGDVKVMGGELGPGAGVDIPDAIYGYIFRIMCVPAGNRLKTVFGGTPGGIQGDIFAQHPVKSFPFLGIFRHMHRPGAHFDPQIVHPPEGFDKQTTAGHDFIKVVSVGD